MILKNSRTTKELVHSLRNIFDDDEFVNGVLLFAEDEYDRKIILDFIHKGNDVTVETITVMALELNDAR